MPEDVRDPGADFTDLAITRLELSGQRRETAEATRWLDEDNRELLSLWWLEASGELTRDEIVAAIDVTRQHAAVRIQRMKGQLETARVVVRALAASPPCPDLRLLTAEWDGRPNALWRKRIARHTRDCLYCSSAWSGLVAAERLLAGMALVPVPHALSSSGVWGDGAEQVAGHSASAVAGKIVTKGFFGVGRRVLTAALATIAVFGVGAAVVFYRNAGGKPAAQAAVVVSTEAPRPRLVPPSAPPTPSLSPSATPAPTRTRTRTRSRAAVPVVTASEKKGVGVWAFTA